nr:lytic transglycosylase domain-containing protein [Labedaea rhizosphaerae]
MGKGYTGQHSRSRRRKAGLAVAAGSLLLVPGAMAAGDTLALAAPPKPAAPQAPRPAPTNPDVVGADGSLPADSQVGTQLLANAGKPLDLAGAGPRLDMPNGPLGIPGAALQAYMRAADLMKTLAPDCHISWPLLASIGRIESGHARGGQVDAHGNTLAPILGPVLNGGGFAAIADTDGGQYDGDAVWDRAVGPMQFIPSTWRGYASDGNADGVTSPSNIYDATLGAAKYLCSGGFDLSNPQEQAIAVFRYNHSDSYVQTVLMWADAYARGVTPLPMTPVPPDVVRSAMDNPMPGTTPSGSGHTPPPTTSTTSGKPTKTTIPGAPTTTTIPGSSTTTKPTTTSPTTTSPTTTSPTCTTSSSPTSSSTPESASGSASADSSVTATSTTNSADSTNSSSNSTDSATDSTTSTTPAQSC